MIATWSPKTLLQTERYLVYGVFHPGLFKDSEAKRSISTRKSTEKVTEIVINPFRKLISAFWLSFIWRDSGRLFHYRFKISPPLFYSSPKCPSVSILKPEQYTIFKNTNTSTKNRKELFKKIALVQFGLFLSI